MRIADYTSNAAADDDGRVVCRELTAALFTAPDTDAVQLLGAVRVRMRYDAADPYAIELHDWHGWAADVDERGRPFSSTEGRLVEVVAALAARRPLRLDGVLNLMGSWETPVWRILTEWGTGGNNRDRAGRATVTARPHTVGGGW